MSNDRIAALLAELIAVARVEFGEPEYTYHKIHHVWAPPGRGRRSGSHSSLPRIAPECTKAKYEAKFAQGERDRGEAFMGRLHTDFYTYERRLKTDGWPQRLIALIEAHADDRGLDDGHDNPHG